MSDAANKSDPVGDTSDPPVDTNKPAAKSSVPLGPPVFGRFRWWIVVVPFVVYLLGTYACGYVEGLRIDSLTGEIDAHHGDEHRMEQEFDIEKLEQEAAGEMFLFGLLRKDRNSYPYSYTATISITTLLVLIVSPGLFRAPFKISFWPFIVGATGVIAWVGLASLDDKSFDFGARVAEFLGGGRPAFNPFEVLKDDPTWMWQFLAIRFFGLVVVVSLVEEFFLRGFLIRYVEDPDWDLVPLGVARNWVWFVPTVYGIVAHPAEPLSALVWFSMVTWMYRRTGSVWDCVLAHAITNALLGVYIVKFGAWELW